MKKILLVDDDRTFLKSIGEFLKREGYAVFLASNGKMALQLLQKEKPDLVVLDVLMPGMSGYEVAHHIKFDFMMEDLPIVLFTSEPRTLDYGVGNSLGIDYMHKSASPADLVKKIARILKLSRKVKAAKRREFKDMDFRPLFEHDLKVSEGIKRILEFGARTAVRSNTDKSRYLDD